MRDLFTTTVEGAAAFERRHGDDYPLDVPDAGELAELAAESRAATQRIAEETWAVGADRCPEGTVTILERRDTPGRWHTVCRHPDHDGWSGPLLVGPTESRDEARARAIAHHASTGHPYGEPLPDPESTDVPF